MTERGAFIVLEGVDGTGKTTLSKSLAKRLESNGRKVIITAEPTNGKIGSMLSEGTGNQKADALLFIADRACHTNEILTFLDKGYDVICDRYYASTLAYQTAAGMDIEWLWAVNKDVIIKPDYTLLLDLDPSKCIERIDSRGERSRFEKIDYQHKVRAIYLQIAERDGFRIIDAGKDPSQVLEDAYNIVAGDKHASI